MAKTLYFKTNSRHIGQLGRELVTDFVTALVELVKNSYDADAGSVRIQIEKANTPSSRIIIADTGSGMTQDEFEKRWMVIGTSNKLSLPYTEKGRKKVGKKGIGRFSVERLAERVTIYSYTQNEDFKVSINWNLYEEISSTGLQQRIRILKNKNDVAAAKYIANQVEYYLSLRGVDEKDRILVEKFAGAIIEDYELVFNYSFLEAFEETIIPILKKQEQVELQVEDIKNPLWKIVDREKEESYQILKALYEEEKEAKENHEEVPVTGVVMVLDRLRDDWRQRDIDKLQKELRLLVAPEFIEKDPFQISLEAAQFKIPEEMSVNSILDLSFAKLDAKISDNGYRMEIYYRDKDGRNKEVTQVYETPLLCGDVNFELYYFLRDPAHMQNETYNVRFASQILNTFCGIKIYRDNFRVKPYGDIGNDWLELDKEKIKDTHGYRVGNNQTIGVIKISDEKNPLLIDATNREGIIENQAYEQLREFILKCINVISTIRKEAMEKTPSELEKAKKENREQEKKAETHRREQDEHYKHSLELLRSGADYEEIKTSLDQWKKKEEQFQKKTKEQYRKTEDAYQNYVEYQETELSMYKNLATLGILTGNFGHETQDIISRINSTLAFYEIIAPTVQNSHFKELTQNIISDFSRISGYSLMIVEFLKKKKRNPEANLNFKEVLDGICGLYIGMLNAFNVKLTWEAEEDISLTMRQIDLESVIINMITNAFEQVKTSKNRRIHIQFKQEENDIYLIFEDTGRGVPINIRNEIFNAFKTTKEDGIGLGLNIVKDIVTNYHGTVQIMDSQRFGGAKFVIHFRKKERVE